MIKYRIKTLQQKTVIFVLIPTFLFLTAMGWGGFLFAKRSLLIQWSETAIAHLQRAAHRLDMRLERPKELLQRIEYMSGAGMAHVSLQYTLEQLDDLDGVKDVNIHLPGGGQGPHEMKGEAGKHHFVGQLEVSSPEYVWRSSERSVLLLSTLNDSGDGQSGQIAVEIGISDLIEQIARSEWWQSNKTMLVDTDGNVIAHSSHLGTEKTFELQKFGNGSALEMETLAAIKNNVNHGTVFGKGNIPRQISGFYRLSGVPWFLVVVAPGKTVLQPILTFRLYYSFLFATAILLIILFIRSMTVTMTGAIKDISKAAESLANGVFGPPLPVQTSDEIGELTNSFNRMTAQIKQGMELQKAMEIAREVQQNFLPSSRYTGRGIEIFGSSRYSQETGGDFFDLVPFSKEPQKIGAIVGDVVGHGIGAALLMASVRAMVRTRNEQPGNLAEIVTDVNGVLCRDTQASSNFVTLFYITVNRQTKTLEWVRAGHDPALLVYSDRHECVELYGAGVAMGVDDGLRYDSSVADILPEKQLIVIGSDGAWEAENSQGEMFGKQRLKQLILDNSGDAPETIIERINDEIDSFLDGSPPQDDITFVIIKIDGEKFL